MPMVAYRLLMRLGGNGIHEDSPRTPWPALFFGRVPKSKFGFKHHLLLRIAMGYLRYRS